MKITTSYEDLICNTTTVVSPTLLRRGLRAMQLTLRTGFDARYHLPFDSHRPLQQLQSSVFLILLLAPPRVSPLLDPR